ncbi:hypothetical protein LshimejAT787_0605630 [Lyophyllum shimeji]|uniref:Uncharacterized protein n=1 Tax=Lyophyllum shimeji TaxID=47721 RepID=A0A9P3UQN1_LYOSH|nr:hypothetical protein LshimejAT787_0605630 [Lyophyllum shimeji]
MRIWKENEDRSIVFHTLPPAPKTPSIAEDGEGAPARKSTSATQPTRTSSKANATLNVSRLLSVVEIVKREFIKSLQAKHSPRLAGLHQYNEIGCLEDLEMFAEEPREEDRATEIARALSGVHHVRQKQTPYMKVTLSTCALPELVEKGATYQLPIIRKLSKSAKLRMKKRERAAKHAGASKDQVGSDAMVSG